MTISVLLADDHALVREGLRLLLEAHADLKVVASVPDGRQAVAQARQLSPDVVVMDISMPGLSGIEAARMICDARPAIKVLILSMLRSSGDVHRALQAGARGYLLKEAAGAELVTAVRALHAGRRYLSKEIGDQVLSDHLSGHAPEDPLERLSPRERSILKLIVEGRSNADAAQMLHLSVKTVETYRSRLMQKLGMRDLPALVKFAIEHGVTALH